MSDWLSWTLTDFLLFSPRTYYRLFGLYNADLWPLHVAILAAGGAILVLAFARRPPWRGRLIAALLAAAWLFVALAWHFHRYDGINFAGSWFALAFGVEALLLLILGVLRDGLRLSPRVHPAGLAGIAIFVFALALQPLIGPLFGRDWASVEVFGLAPDPTAVGTLGILLAAERVRWSLMMIPLLWCLVTGLTLWTMEAPDAFVTPLAGGLVLVLVVWKASRGDSRRRLAEKGLAMATTKQRGKRQALRTTHAGGIPFRIVGDEVEYLLVRANEPPDAWVFPKGHIEPGETAKQAAKREVMEEAGIRVKIVGRVGWIPASAEGMAVMFLMELVGDDGASGEGRERVWLALKPALHALAFEESRDLLRRVDQSTGHQK